jgi:hypothetical protein
VGGRWCDIGRGGADDASFSGGTDLAFVVDSLGVSPRFPDGGGGTGDGTFF